MRWLKDVYNRQICLTPERHKHIKIDHPEMSQQIISQIQ